MVLPRVSFRKSWLGLCLPLHLPNLKIVSEPPGVNEALIAVWAGSYSGKVRLHSICLDMQLGHLQNVKEVQIVSLSVSVVWEVEFFLTIFQCYRTFLTA